MYRIAYLEYTGVRLPKTEWRILRVNDFVEKLAMYEAFEHVSGADRR